MHVTVVILASEEPWQLKSDYPVLAQPGHVSLCTRESTLWRVRWNKGLSEVGALCTIIVLPM
jgi:hypothetical protein